MFTFGGSFWNQFKACTRWLKKSNKQTNKQKRQKRKRKTKQKTEKGGGRSTNLRLTALFFTLQQPSSFKMTAVEMASRTVFHGGGYSTLACTGVCRPDLGTLTHV